MLKISLWIPFSLALIPACLSGIFFSDIKFMAFAPFLGILYHRKTLAQTMWIAGGCGLLIDLLSSQMRFGIYALNYILTSLLLFSHRRHFFNDKPLALSCFVAIISLVSTALEFALLFLFDKGFPLSTSVFLTELIGMPVADALYALMWFTCPISAYERIRRFGWARALRLKTEKE